MGKKVKSMIIATPAGMQRTKRNFVPDFQLGRQSGQGAVSPQPENRLIPLTPWQEKGLREL
jgi:hypothetical protein